jgi:hypothetical protein
MQKALCWFRSFLKKIGHAAFFFMPDYQNNRQLQRVESLMKQKQSAKIKEIKDVLIAEGLVTLTSQADALGLSRSTTWAVLKANHKASGLSGAVIKRMLLAPRLPAAVRAKILEYVREKSAGMYGHSRKRLRLFDAQLKQPEATSECVDWAPSPGWPAGDPG